MDNNTKVILLCCFSFIMGIIVTLIIIDNIIMIVGSSFQVENINTTVTLNQSMLMDAIEHINQTRGAP